MNFYFEICIVVTIIEFGISQANANTIRDNFENSGDAGIEINLSSISTDKFEDLNVEILENSNSAENSGDSENDTLNDLGSGESSGESDVVEEFDKEIAVFFEGINRKISGASKLPVGSDDVDVESNKSQPLSFCTPIILLALYLF